MTLWAAIMASRKTKIGGGIVAGGTTFALVMNMLGARLDDLDKKIEAKDKEIRTWRTEKLALATWALFLI